MSFSLHLYEILESTQNVPIFLGNRFFTDLFNFILINYCLGNFADIPALIEAEPEMYCM